MDRRVLGWSFLKRVADKMQGVPHAEEPWAFQYGFCQHVIAGILGASLDSGPISKASFDRAMDWVFTHIHKRHHETLFLRSSSPTRDEFTVHLWRLTDLAEVLFNLQFVPGIHDSIYQRIIKNPEGFEATMLELEGLRLFRLAQIPFRLKSQVEGKRNYECDLILSNGLTAPCEMKCKVEGTSISEPAIKEPIKTARKQLPKGGCGIVLLKIPTEWGFTSETKDIIDSTVRGVLRSTTRLAEVIIYQRDVFMGKAISAHPIYYRGILNEKSPYFEQLGGSILEGKIPVELPRNWLPFSIFTSHENVHRLVEAQTANPQPPPS